MQQSNEDARRVSQWLSMPLLSIGYQDVIVGNVQLYGLDAPVYINGVCVGTLGACYQQFRDGVLIERLHQELP